MDEKLRTSFTRRELLRTAAIVGGALGGSSVLSACGGGAEGSGGGTPVVFADYGGSTRDAYRKAYFEPFEKESGHRVVSASVEPSQFIQMSQRERSKWDAADTVGFLTAYYVMQGLAEKLPPEVTRCDYVPGRFRDYAAGGYTQSFNVVYRTDVYKDEVPESWADFWDTKKFPGKRGFPGYYEATGEAALLADGVPPDDLFPLDLGRAFAKLDELRPHMLIYEEFGQGQQQLQAHSVDMTMLPNGRAAELRGRGVPIELVWNEAITDLWTAAAVPHGGPNPDAAFQLVDFMSQPERQAEFARLTGYGPTQSKAYDLLDEETLSVLAATPEHREVAAVRDPSALARQYKEYADRFSKWLAG